MCFFGNSGPDPSVVARQSEERRAGRIREGTANINQQFEGFNPEFFGEIEQSALDFFNPQLTEQFQGTREGVVKNLARSGNLSGSVGATTLGNLFAERAKQQARIGERARGIAGEAKAGVERNRASLIQNLSATADPFAAAQAAGASAASLSAPQQFSPLGDAFSRFSNLASPQIQAARAGIDTPFSGLFRPSGNSQTIVTA